MAFADRFLLPKILRDLPRAQADVGIRWILRRGFHGVERRGDGLQLFLRLNEGSQPVTGIGVALKSSSFDR